MTVIGWLQILVYCAIIVAIGPAGWMRGASRIG
jgi:hypothetical protein